MINKILRNISFLTTLAISACAVAPENMDRTRNTKLQKENVKVNEKEDQPPSTQFVTRQIAGEPGLIHIERRTKEYSISMTLDASDENVYFEMDLPQDEPEQKNTEEVSEQIQAPEDTESKVDDEETEQPPVEVTEQPKEEEIDEEKIEESPPEQRDEAKASKYVLYAQTYFFEKKYARALEEIKRAIEYSPDSGVAHSLKGSINYKMGDIEKARSSWNEALRLDASLDNVEKMLSELDKMDKTEPNAQDNK